MRVTMKKWLYGLIISLMLLFGNGCKTQKHIDYTNEQRIEYIENRKIDAFTYNDKNTITDIEITEYLPLDTLKGVQEIKSITKVKQTNRDKIKQEMRDNTDITTNEDNAETIIEEKQTNSTSIWWYIISYIGGIVSTIIIWLLIKLGVRKFHF